MLNEPLLADDKFRLSNPELIELFNTENLKKNDEERKITKMLVILEQMEFAEGIASGLNSNLNAGIEATVDDISDRKEKFGDNAIKPRKATTIC